MMKDNFADDLETLGIHSANVSLLMLLPLVYVAWADGQMSQVEKDRIVAYARQHFDLDEEARTLLRSWLSTRPSDEYFARGMRDLHRLAHAPDEPSISLEDLSSLLAYCEAVSRTGAQTLGEPWSVTIAEERALQTVAQMLGVDNGRSWSQLFRELDEPPLPPEDNHPTGRSGKKLAKIAPARDRRPLRSMRTLIRQSDSTGRPEPKGGVV